ncbi:hypothetical protein HZC20_03460 [Candidatus Peregrinibacteria bacterium]|nr:hypothetical protein [Candidatus Peregrinibacteria bacterium]
METTPEQNKQIFFGRYIKYFAYVLFAIGFAWVFSTLFFEKETGLFLGYLGRFPQQKQTVVSSMNDLRVIYPEEPTTLESTVNASSVRYGLNNIYEPLVRLDRDMKIRPALALSWGIIDEHTWEFALRPNVVFQDGSTFEAGDVLASIKRAKKYYKSELKDLLLSIKEVKVINPLTVRITTNDPDPILLQRLANVLIIPSEYKDKSLDQPIGTGSYQFKKWISGDRMVLTSFNNYWGNKSKFKNVELVFRTDKSERVNMFLRGEGDVLAFVPFDGVQAVKDAGFKIASIPTLEVQYLFFNVNSDFFSTPEKRKGFSNAFDKESFVKNIGSYSKTDTQFVSNGVFGFNPNISAVKYDAASVKNFVKNNNFNGKVLKFHLPKGMDFLGEYVRQTLGDSGISVIVSYLEMADFLKSMQNKDADLYFLGFKSDFGDAIDFFKSVAFSKGEFNFGGYSNSDVDRLVKQALIEMDITKRRNLLQEAMRIVVKGDPFGVPLFEYEKIFSFVNQIVFEPRIDGMIYFDELTLKSK